SPLQSNPVVKMPIAGRLLHATEIHADLTNRSPSQRPAQIHRREPRRHPVQQLGPLLTDRIIPDDG
ncbi:MAG: hypothetical protein ACC645_23895, partial [Pirellulales bacterium]